MNGQSTWRRQADLAEIAYLLVLLQAGIALLTAIGGIVYALVAPGSRGVLVTTVLEVGLFVVLVLLASGILRRRRWSYSWMLRLEAVVLMGSCLTLFFGMGVSATLSFLVADLLLPLAVLTLVAATRPGGRAG